MTAGLALLILAAAMPVEPDVNEIARADRAELAGWWRGTGACRGQRVARRLAEILERVLKQLGSHYEALEKEYEDAGWVSYRLAEVLPISLELKQRCLATPEAEDRLALLRPVLDQLRVT